MRIFVDTGALIAVADVSDQHHRDAADFVTLELGRFQQVTINFVLCETLNFLRTRSGYNAALQVGQRLRRGKGIQLVRVTLEIENLAWDLFTRYRDKDVSFTDCTSFVVMRELGIQHAFAFDKHFTQLGFIRLPLS